MEIDSQSYSSFDTNFDRPVKKSLLEEAYPE